MEEIDLDNVLKELYIKSFRTSGIRFIYTKNQKTAFDAVQKLLLKLVTKKTALFLSGGRTPKKLYEMISLACQLNPGAVALVDERFGEKFHQNSNELMLKKSGVLGYLNKKNIQFYPILEKGSQRAQTAKDYDETVRYLFNYFQKTVGILGVGLDGHTAGLPANPSLWKRTIRQDSKNNFVIEYNDSTGFYKERVSMTFLALSLLDLLIVIVLGKDKKKALKLMLSEGSLEEVPSRFFKQDGIYQKTLFFTDVKI